MLSRGRRLSLAGWLFIPTIAVGAVFYDVFMWLPLWADLDSWTQFRPASHIDYGATLLFASVGLFTVGVGMALSCFAPRAIRLGHSARLATQAALLISVAFLLECHRALLFAWYLNDFAEASRVWAVRDHLLLGVGAIAALALFQAWRGRRGPRETPRLRRAAKVLTVLQLALMALALFTLEVSARTSYWVPSLLTSPPLCPVPPCTPGNLISKADEPLGPYPVYQTDLVVIDAGWATNIEELEARWAE
jgi:hypothetical protein